MAEKLAQVFHGTVDVEAIFDNQDYIDMLYQEDLAKKYPSKLNYMLSKEQLQSCKDGNEIDGQRR
jgi:hypothetical protein